MHDIEDSLEALLRELSRVGNASSGKAYEQVLGYVVIQWLYSDAACQCIHRLLY